MKEILDRIFERNRLNRRLHWTTIASEKVLLAIIGLLSVIASGQYIWGMFEVGVITLADLFLLFIYVEIIGMIGAFYSTNRIPVTLPIIIAITALCRLIIMQSKDMEALTLIAEAGFAIDNNQIEMMRQRRVLKTVIFYHHIGPVLHGKAQALHAVSADINRPIRRQHKRLIADMRGCVLRPIDFERAFGIAAIAA